MDASSRKRSQADMRSWNLSSKLIDEEMYRTTILHLFNAQTEDELDEHLQRQVQDLGLLPLQVTTDIEGITSSLSASTIASGFNRQASIESQSTAPTSCSSSEHRPVTQSSMVSEMSVPPSHTALAILSDVEKRRSSGFRNGIRKMAAFKKRKSIALSSSTLTSRNSDSNRTHESDRNSSKSGMKSATSIKSSKSSWSSPISANKPSYEQAVPVDPDALRRGLECKQMLDLRETHLRERGRFLEFQQTLIAELRAQRDESKLEKRSQHQIVLDEQQIGKAVEDLEARQLEEEMKMEREHQNDKQKAMVRLRYMEAYCHNPTPPPTPVDPTSGRPSLETCLYGRRVTDKDYHNLAQQYRERDGMDDLHASKINVLRGRQKKAVENLVRKREREIDKLEQEHEKEIGLVDKDFASQEDRLKVALDSKRVRLEMRWRTQALIERTKMCQQTGLEYAALPEVVAVEESRAPLVAA